MATPWWPNRARSSNTWSSATATARFVPAAGTPDKLRYTYFLHYAEGSAMPPLLMKLVFDRIETAPMPFFVKPIARAIARKVKGSFIMPQILQHLAFLEAELGKRTWFAGEEFTAADIQLSFRARSGGLARRAGRKISEADRFPAAHPCAARPTSARWSAAARSRSGSKTAMGKLLAIDGLNIVRRVYEASPEPDSHEKADIALRHALSSFRNLLAAHAPTPRAGGLRLRRHHLAPCAVSALPRTPRADAVVPARRAARLSRQAAPKPACMW